MRSRVCEALAECDTNGRLITLVHSFKISPARPSLPIFNGRLPWYKQHAVLMSTNSAHIGMESSERGKSGNHASCTSDSAAVAKRLQSELMSLMARTLPGTARCSDDNTLFVA